jgi:hypothetical protein
MYPEFCSNNHAKPNLRKVGNGNLMFLKLRIEPRFVTSLVYFPQDKVLRYFDTNNSGCDFRDYLSLIYHNFL